VLVNVLPAETRYSPAECTGSFTQRITGEPEGAYISTTTPCG